MPCSFLGCLGPQKLRVSSPSCCCHLQEQGRSILQGCFLGPKTFSLCRSSSAYPWGAVWDESLFAPPAVGLKHKGGGCLGTSQRAPTASPAGRRAAAGTPIPTYLGWGSSAVPQPRPSTPTLQGGAAALLPNAVPMAMGMRPPPPNLQNPPPGGGADLTPSTPTRSRDAEGRGARV